MAEPIVLSGSSMGTYLRCPRQWEHVYVRRDRQRPNLKAALGTAAHAAAELDYRQKVTSGVELPKDVVLDAFRDAYVESSYDAVEKPEKKETIPLFLDSGIQATGFWYDDVAPLYQPVLVEQNGQFTINGIHYDWTLDYTDDKDVVGDWKFVGRTPNSAETYVLNMIGYAIGFRRLTGEIESGVRLDHVVRLKKPIHVPIEGPTVPDDDIYAFADTVKSVYDSIQMGSFPPNGLKSGACSWCAYADGTCKAYRRPKNA